ncbi:MAG: lytic murein transglycosylase [Gammaproteobacteria bacterium]|nr:lytic murein transglycosylase [Gammaproteobacteria bacterium]
MKKFIIGLILVISAIVALTFIPSEQQPAPMPWQITLMPDGQISVFNIHLGTTSYRQAQQSLKMYGQTSIFSQQGRPSTVEAFFNSINLGGLSAKLVLNLIVDNDEIEKMKSRALEARLQPSGAHQYQLSNQDNASLVNAAVGAITYIPSVRLDKEMLIHRFGLTDLVSHDSENPDTEVWQYPALGLTIYLNPNEKTILQYQMIPLRE